MASLLFSSILLTERFLPQNEAQRIWHWGPEQLDFIHWSSRSGGQVGSMVGGSVVGGGVGEGEKEGEDER